MGGVRGSVAAAGTSVMGPQKDHAESGPAYPRVVPFLRGLKTTFTWKPALERSQPEDSQNPDICRASCR